LESLQKKLEHQSRLTAQVMAILELAKAKLQALLRNPNISPVDPATLRLCEGAKTPRRWRLAPLR
jgi:hypothetical protein